MSRATRFAKSACIHTSTVFGIHLKIVAQKTKSTEGKTGGRSGAESNRMRPAGEQKKVPSRQKSVGKKKTPPIENRRRRDERQVARRRLNLPTKQFGSALISLLSAACGWPFPATLPGTGWRQGANCSTKLPERANKNKNSGRRDRFDRRHTFLHFFEQSIDRERFRN